MPFTATAETGYTWRYIRHRDPEGSRIQRGCHTSAVIKWWTASWL